MKETKVYMSKLPKCCSDCPCCSCELKPEFIKIRDFMYCNLLKQKFRFKEERKKLKDCPLIDIKTHDREVVKEVCEKIRKELDGDYNQYRLNHILNQIQKEIEK